MATGGGQRGGRRRRSRTPDPSSLEEMALALGQARAASGLSLDDVQRRTGVPLRHLEALEAGDLTHFLDGKTAAASVRRFADVVGLDVDVMVAVVEVYWKEGALVPTGPGPSPTAAPDDPPTTVVPAVTRTAPPVAVVAPLAPVEDPPTTVVPVVAPLQADEAAFTTTAEIPVVAPVATPSPAPAPAADTTGTMAVPASPALFAPVPGEEAPPARPGRTPRAEREPAPPKPPKPPKPQKPSRPKSRVPLPLRVGVWATATLLLAGLLVLGLHRQVPRWWADLNRPDPTTTSTSTTTTTPGVHATQTSTGGSSATVAVSSPDYQLVVHVLSRTWIFVNSDDPSQAAADPSMGTTPRIFEGILDTGPDQTYTPVKGNLTVQMGASGVVLGLEVNGKVVPNWLFTPQVAPFTLSITSGSG